MSKFLIVMTAEGDTWDHLDDHEQQQLMAKYDEWVNAMTLKGQYHQGAAAGRAEIVTVDGKSQPVTGERITGQFTVEAPDFEQAKQIATGCPAFEHGETVVVYEVT